MGTLAYHPLNLALRFLLELAALAFMAACGWQLTDSLLPRLAAVVALPALAASVWGIFAVPADPSRSGKAPVPVSGVIRIVLELAFFGFAVWSLSTFAVPMLSLLFGVLVLLHYVASYDRIKWLLRSKGRSGAPGDSVRDRA